MEAGTRVGVAVAKWELFSDAAALPSTPAILETRCPFSLTQNEYEDLDLSTRIQDCTAEG